MDEAERLVRQAAADACSNDDLVRSDMEMFMEGQDPYSEVPYSQFDTETLDEKSTPLMGERWESVRRDAN